MDTPLLDTALYTAPVSPANQDRGFIDSVHCVFGVFDGMAGEKGGDMAAEFAKRHIEDAMRTLAQPLSLEQGKLVLAMMLRNATEALYKRAQELKNAMATTASVCLFASTEGGAIVVVIGNVGDSRVYALDPEGNFQQITLDDGPIRFAGIDEQTSRVVQAKLNNVQDAALLSLRERRLFADRHLMTQVLGDEEMTPRIHTLTVADGWSILLTTDGVHDNLTDNEMREIVRTIVNAYEGVQTLIERATQRSHEGGGTRTSRRYDGASHTDWKERSDDAYSYSRRGEAKSTSEHFRATKEDKLVSQGRFEGTSFFLAFFFLCAIVRPNQQDGERNDRKGTLRSLHLHDHHAACRERLLRHTACPQLQEEHAWGARCELRGLLAFLFVRNRLLFVDVMMR